VPNLKPTSGPPKDDLDVATKIMRTVERQIASYRSAIGSLRKIRLEAERDPALVRQMRKSPEAMVAELEQRGIPKPLAAAMAAEDHKTVAFPGGELGFWTWSCCCSVCCITCISDTTVNANSFEAGPVAKGR
jgi:hypothetical protein